MRHAISHTIYSIFFIAFGILQGIIYFVNLFEKKFKYFHALIIRVFGCMLRDILLFKVTS